jgi:hypothetical protein
VENRSAGRPIPLSFSFVASSKRQRRDCGSATMDRHPRSGEGVERSRDALLSIKERYDALIARGLPVATELSRAVNQRIEREAKRIANETDEIQSPRQISHHHVDQWCAECAGGRAQTVLHLGQALAVIPDARWEDFVRGVWPSDPGP